MVLCFEPTASKHFRASASGICSSPSPCTIRNGQVIFCTTPSRRNPSSFFMASSRVPTLKIHKARDAARDQVRHALEVLDFLGDVEAVEEHQRRYCAGALRQWFRVHENSGKRSALVRYLNVLDAYRRGVECFRDAAQLVR